LFLSRSHLDNSTFRLMSVIAIIITILVSSY